MALSACVECGKLISTEAASCPSCGKPSPHCAEAPTDSGPTAPPQALGATDWPVWLALLFVVVFVATCATVGAAWVPLGIPWWIAATVAVARDAKSRGMDGSAVWMLSTLFLGPLGLLVYVLARQGGGLVACPACYRARLVTSSACPHCAGGWLPRTTPTGAPALTIGAHAPMRPEDKRFLAWVALGSLALVGVCLAAAAILGHRGAP